MVGYFDVSLRLDELHLKQSRDPKTPYCNRRAMEKIMVFLGGSSVHIPIAKDYLDGVHGFIKVPVFERTALAFCACKAASGSRTRDRGLMSTKCSR